MCGRTPLPYKVGETNVTPESFGYNGFGVSGSTVKIALDTKITAMWIINCDLYMAYPGGAGGLAATKAYLLALTSAGDSYCHRCKWGYQLKIKCSGDPVAASGTDPALCKALIMICDTPIDDCNTEVVYGGFPAWINTMASCHECKTPGNNLGIL